MQVALSDFKTDAGRYVDLCETEDIIIIKNGVPAAKIIGFNENSKKVRKLKEIPKKITSIEQLFGTLSGSYNLDEIRTERLSG